ncbi:flagellar basal-body MS-ring/collar protein FliF [Rheinheimera sp. 1928-s]|uniref:flagellar basal-body MS-ring/collar protein FliF n=1 Tax=Rheinheimera sp. 1928-s TaxID=3033803 RepID=UPI002621A7C7|nr:flagellar basal-body MS-ring/collar protein FliF [Rheinheimera sp. 1928-s]MDF3125136.1 flagellar basal-body MS-ring/collar protein FliF [Rheinheimera sp. 1928-s]
MKTELAKALPVAASDNRLRERVINLSSKINWLPAGDKSLASIALLATLVAATIVVILWTSAKNFVPLYGNQEHYDKAGIVEILDKEQFPFRIDTDSGNIMVPQERLADARITLAARGIKAAMPEGLSAMQDKVTMGTSQFMESMQYQHALEGELARTIITMDGVRNARVHLAIPKRNLFVGRQEEQSAASVMVDLAPGYNLKPEQVEAIVSLVSGSIPGLDSRKISVVDQRGKLVSGDLFDETPVGKETDKKLAFIEKVERSVEERASIMLLPILGDGNYRIQVSADVDFNVVEETREALDKEGVLKSENSKTDSMLDQLAMGIPGSLANQPPVPVQQGAEAAPENNERTSQRNEIRREFDTGKAITHTRYEIGRVRSQSVSVLVNEAAAGATPWTPERLAQLGEMIKTATGHQAERGDQFNITSFGFVQSDAAAQMEGMAWWQMPEMKEYLRYLIGAIIGLALVIFGVRPLVNHLVSRKSKEQHAAGFQGTTGTHTAAQMQNADVTTGPAVLDATADPALPNTQATGPQHNMHLPEVGSEFAQQISHLQLLANRESDRVTAVIKYWIERGVSIESVKS